MHLQSDKSLAQGFAALVALTWIAISSVQAQDWQEFRGAGGRGHSSATGLPVEWTKEQIRWQTKLPGRGWSSPVVVENEIWMTTALENAAEADGGLVLAALCVDRETGGLLHDRSALMPLERIGWVVRCPQRGNAALSEDAAGCERILLKLTAGFIPNAGGRFGR